MLSTGMSDRDDILAQYYQNPSTTDVIDRIPRPTDPLDIKAYLRDQAMRGARLSPETLAAIQPTPQRDPNWFERALSYIPPEAMLAANFLSPGVRLPPPRISNPIRAYHGSPYDFERFDTSRGSGLTHAQGTHFAGEERMAQEFKVPLNNRTPAKMYEVNLHAAPDEILHMGRAINNQPSYNRIRKTTLFDPSMETMTGKDAWRAMQKTYGEDARTTSPWYDFDAAFSNRLAERGIKVAQYGEPGTGGAHYVVLGHEPSYADIIEILRKYGVAAVPAAGVAAEQMTKGGE